MSESLSHCDCGGCATVGFETDTGYLVECENCGYKTKSSQDLDLVVAQWNVRNLYNQALEDELGKPRLYRNN